jgi:hypothetical protein
MDVCSQVGGFFFWGKVLKYIIPRGIKKNQKTSFGAGIYVWLAKYKQSNFPDCWWWHDKFYPGGSGGGGQAFL